MNRLSSNAEKPLSESTSTPLTQRARAICFYLPQFHQIPENDEWWGKGFTEWTNVRAASPRYKGHYQPHVPGEFGYYDLLDEHMRVAQAALAAQHGIHGFCYYHYWFAGRRLLEKPLDNMLASGKPDFPFCLCWANESWSRTWSGRDHEILIRQEYSDVDHRAHIAWLVGVFQDHRYIRVGDRPLLLIYRPESIPDVKIIVAEWKAYCVDNLSVEPYLCAVTTGFSTAGAQALIASGFDALVDFQPNRSCFPAARNATGQAVSLARKILPPTWYDALRNNMLLGNRSLSTVINYRAYVEACLGRKPPASGPCFPCVFPSWDNSARRTAATIIENHDAEDYGRWLDGALAQVDLYPEDTRLVFINAWNEWAEGCHLEPDDRHGLQFLEATRKSLQNN
jgi:lipopolysaccharide biosynthesis protein